MRDYRLRLDKFGIDFEMYNELRWFCRQHRTRKSRLNATRIGFNDLAHRESRVADPSDPTARRALLTAKYQRDIDALEGAARRAAGPVIAPFIVKNAVEGTHMNKLLPPCGVNQFYAMRQLFFYYLALNLNKVPEKPV